MQYTIVSAESNYPRDAIKKVEKEVERLCNDGWKPQGGVSVSVTISSYTYAQALVKEEEN